MIEPLLPALPVMAVKFTLSEVKAQFIAAVPPYRATSANFEAWLSLCKLFNVDPLGGYPLASSQIRANMNKR